MAGLRFQAQIIEVDTGTAKKTVVQVLAPANQKVLVHGLACSFEGITNTGVPILVEVAFQSTAGSGGDALTLVKDYAGDDETLQTTALSNIDGSTQPTETSVWHREKVHPQGGWSWTAPFGKEIQVKGGTRLGIAVTASAAVDCTASISCEE